MAHTWKMTTSWENYWEKTKLLSFSEKRGNKKRVPGNRRKKKKTKGRETNKAGIKNHRQDESRGTKKSPLKTPNKKPGREGKGGGQPIRSSPTKDERREK